MIAHCPSHENHVTVQASAKEGHVVKQSREVLQVLETQEEVQIKKRR